MDATVLICPLCGAGLVQREKQLVCGAGHSFDIAREDYVNLLVGHKPGCNRGDNGLMTRARSRFLSAGYYAPLARALATLEQAYAPPDGTALDICCGEGWYSAALAAAHPGVKRYGFDLSRDMVRLSAKRRCGTFFVANIAAIPVADSAIDFGIHLFAPFQETEFRRVLKPEGTLVTVFPGKNHLWSLKRLLYDTPYYNDEKSPPLTRFRVQERLKVDFSIKPKDTDALKDLFYMTPYAYHTPASGLERLKTSDLQETECSFILLVLKPL